MLYFLKHNDIKTTVVFTIVCIAIATLLIGCPIEPEPIDTTPPALSIQISDVSISNGQVSFSLTNPNNEVVEGRISVDPAPPSDAIYMVDGSVIENDARVSLASADSAGATKQVQITQLNNGTEYTITITTLDTAGNAQSVTGTTSQTPGVEYICTNGMATGGIAAAENSERCTSCAAGYDLSGAADAEGTVCAPNYICTNGMATGGIAAAENSERCTSCAAGYDLSGAADAVGTVCTPNYICTNGVATSGIAAAENSERCTSCAAGYDLSGAADAVGTVCAPNYICTNGVATAGIAAAENSERCTSCTAGYDLSGAADAEGTVCLARIYTCENGTPIPGRPTTISSQGCATCGNGYYLSAAPGAGATCIENAYSCQNGTPIPGAPLNNGAAGCATCNIGYRLSTTAGAGTTCRADVHGNALMDATAITLNARISGRINTTSDIDVFSFSVDSGRAFRVYTTGSTDTDGTVRLSADSAEIVATDDNNGTNTNFDISVINSVARSQLYYVEVRGSEIGNYELVVEEILSNGSDLVIASASISAASVQIGDSTTILAVVENAGTGLSVATTLRYYLSTDMIINTGDRQLDTDIIPALLPNGMSTADYEITIDTSMLGTFYVGACVDAVAGETNNSNNCSDGILLNSTDDHGNTRADATVVTDGSSTTGSIELGDDVDYFEIEITRTTALTVFTTGSTDTVGTIFDNSGAQLATHGDIGPTGDNRNFLIAYDITTVGTYYIEVSSFGISTGDYTLMVDLTDDDHGNTPMDATSIMDGSSTTGRIELGDDVDYFEISVASSTTLSTSTTGSLDTVGRIFDNSGTQLAFHDDVLGRSDPTNFNFVITYDITAAGTYYIEVSSHSTNVGDYTLMVDLIDDDHGNTRMGATPVIDGSSTTGTIASDSDVDYFAIMITSSTTLTASTIGSLDTIGRLLDNSGRHLASDHDGGRHENFFVASDITTAGTYYIEVSGSGTSTGDYTLMVDLVDDDHGNTRTDATPVMDDSSTTGRIASASDVDYFAISVTNGTTLTASTTGSVNTVGRLLDGNGLQLITHDDIDAIGGNRNFLFTYSITTVGTYYIEVSSRTAHTAEYTLAVDLFDDDHGNTRTDATPVIDGSSTTGTIEPGNDVDYFAISVTGNGTLTASTTGSLDTIGRIFDSSGVQLADADDIDRDSNLNFLVTYDITAAGTYYIEVSSYLFLIGDYTLMVDFTED